MVYNTVLTAEKWGPQIAGAQIAGVYCTTFSTDSNGSIHFNIAMIFKEREVVEVWC